MQYASRTRYAKSVLGVRSFASVGEMGAITLRLVLVGLLSSVRGFELSEPLAGLACDSDADGESLELGHRQLDVSTPNWLQAGKELCAEECEQIAGCTTFHVMQSNGCIDEVGPDVCVPWAECTFFSRCEAMVSDDDQAPDWKATAYFLTDRSAAPGVDPHNEPSTARRQMMEMPAMASMFRAWWKLVQSTTAPDVMPARKR